MEGVVASAPFKIPLPLSSFFYLFDKAPFGFKVLLQGPIRVEDIVVRWGVWLGWHICWTHQEQFDFHPSTSQALNQAHFPSQTPKNHQATMKTRYCGHLYSSLLRKRTWWGHRDQVSYYMEGGLKGTEGSPTPGWVGGLVGRPVSALLLCGSCLPFGLLQWGL